MFSLINIISTLLISTTCLHAMINFEDLYDHSKKKSKNEEKVISRKCPSLNQNLALQAVQGINTQLTINNDLWVVSSLLIQEQTGLTGYPIMVPVFSNITPISSNWTTKLNTFINNNSFQKTKDAGSYNQEGTVCRYAYSYMNNERFF